MGRRTTGAVDARTAKQDRWEGGYGVQRRSPRQGTRGWLRGPVPELGLSARDPRSGQFSRDTSEGIGSIVWLGEPCEAGGARWCVKMVWEPDQGETGKNGLPT